jgi:hypothetical protein
VDLRRLRAADWATGLFGAALVGLLWAPWFSVATNYVHFDRSVGAPAVTILSGSTSGNAWQTMAVNDWIFCIAGLLGVWLPISTALYSTGAVPLAAAAFATFTGLLASVLALVRLAFPPDVFFGPTHREVGVYLGTAAAIAMTTSAVVSMRSERETAAAQVPITELPAPGVSSA